MACHIMHRDVRSDALAGLQRVLRTSPHYPISATCNYVAETSLLNEGHELQ